MVSLGSPTLFAPASSHPCCVKWPRLSFLLLLCQLRSSLSFLGIYFTAKTFWFTIFLVPFLRKTLVRPSGSNTDALQYSQSVVRPWYKSWKWPFVWCLAKLSSSHKGWLWEVDLNERDSDLHWIKKTTTHNSNSWNLLKLLCGTAEIFNQKYILRHCWALWLFLSSIV